MLLKKIPATSGRYRYFNLRIIFLFNLNSLFEQNYIENKSINFDQVLKNNNFITQSDLENKLFDLSTESENQEVNTDVKLRNFYGQLERDKKTGRLYWQVFLETKNLVIPKALRTFFQSYFKISDESLELDRSSGMEPLDETKKFIIFNSDWAPGYFSYKIVWFSKLLKSPEILKAIQDMPTKFSGITITNPLTS